LGFLDEILSSKREELRARKLELPLGELEERCRNLPPARDFAAALRPGHKATVRLIAELKKASPSRGVLAESFDPLSLARTYRENGAAALSVLTDEKAFQGRIELLNQLRPLVDCPLLRKDFILEEYQLFESRALGADAILLIVAALTPAALTELLQAAKGLGLASLVEVHTREELDVALTAGAAVIGVNNRNLQTFETSLKTSLDLIPTIPEGPVVVSESGIFSREDVLRVVGAGALAILVGEALVRAVDVATKVRELALLD
jgi:indole-3-glycerol phosphate synthase